MMVIWRDKTWATNGIAGIVSWVIYMGSSGGGSSASGSGLTTVSVICHPVCKPVIGFGGN